MFSKPQKITYNRLLNSQRIILAQIHPRLLLKSILTQPRSSTSAQLQRGNLGLLQTPPDLPAHPLHLTHTLCSRKTIF